LPCLCLHNLVATQIFFAEPSRNVFGIVEASQ
jgi:hypothetical protein